MDGVDAAVVAPGNRRPEVLAAGTWPFEPAIAHALAAARKDPDRLSIAEMGWLDAALGDAFADVALEVIGKAGCRPGQITAIGSHGQTLIHYPQAAPPFTLQIGDPWRIAHRSGINTVADFRRADLAAGGQGAPLAPLLHAHLFARPGALRLVANLGGIANLTVLMPDRPASGFDTGPANCLLDLWYRRHHPDGAYDAEGRWAASGTVDEAWLETLMQEPFLGRPPPKSTGIEHFSPAWLDARLPAWADDRPADIQATLSEFTAATLTAAIRPLTHDLSGTDLLLCGGGVHNRDLVERIQARLPAVRVESTAAHGLDPDHVEAVLFAWLARQRMRGQRMDTRSITGAAHPVLAGAVFTC